MTLASMNAPLTGIVLFAADLESNRSAVPMVAYIPGDPQSPLKYYANGQAFMQDLANKLRSADDCRRFSAVSSGMNSVATSLPISTAAYHRSSGTSMFRATPALSGVTNLWPKPTCNSMRRKSPTTCTSTCMRTSLISCSTMLA